MPDLFGNNEPKPKPPGAEIRIVIPFGFESEDEDVAEPDLDRYFTSLLDGPFGDALDLDLDDDRAVVDEVKIETVEAHSDEIFVNYVVSFSAYYGCADQNYADDDHRAVEGVRNGNVWVFERHVSPEPLAPNEEF